MAARYLAGRIARDDLDLSWPRCGPTESGHRFGLGLRVATVRLMSPSR
jgi:hypothetical protein